MILALGQGNTSLSLLKILFFDRKVDELDKAISVAARDPAWYGINEVELDKRRRWTSTARTQVSLFFYFLFSDDYHLSFILYFILSVLLLFCCCISLKYPKHCAMFLGGQCEENSSSRKEVGYC